MADLKYTVAVDTAGAVSSLENLKVTLKGVAAAFAIREVAQFGQQIIQSAREFEQYTNQLRLVTNGTEDLNRLMAVLTQEAIKNRTSFSATIDLFTKLRVATEALGISEQRVIDVTGKLSKALQVAGADAATTNSVVRQFGQAMASGTVRGDEFNSLVEGLGPALAIMARETGITVGELRKMSQEGKLTAETMFTMLENSRALNIAFGQMEPTIASLETQFTDSFNRMLVKLGQLSGLTEQYQKILRGGARLADTIAGTEGALVNLKSKEIFDQVQKGSISAAEGVKELEIRLKDARVALTSVGAIAQGSWFKYGDTKKELESLIAALKQREAADKAVADQAAKDLQLDKEKQARLTGILKPYQEYIKLAEEFAKKEYGTQREKLNREIEQSAQVVAKLQEAYAKSGGELGNYNKLLEAAKGKLRDARRELNDLNNQEFKNDFARKEALTIAEQVSAYKNKNEQVLLGLRYNIDNIKLLEQDRALTQTSLRDQEVRQATLQAEKDLQTQINTLKDRAARYAQGTKEERAQVDNLNKAIENLRSVYNSHIEDVRNLTNEYLSAQEARQEYLFGVRRQIEVENELMRVQGEIAKTTMSEIEKKYYDIWAAARASAKSAIEAEEARRGTKLDINEVTRYYQEAFKGTEKLREAQQQLFEQSRRFETGWTNAFRQYVDEATNAARQAERIFQRVTSSMEDMIVEFAKTGKLEFKGFINSILEELLRSRIRQLIAQIFSISGKPSSSGMLGSIGGLLGFANGGIIPTNSPVLVGERGPELISGAAGRNVTPNDQLGLGTTNVIYNISAVDARSFKELVASDPSFIYAVTEQGRRSLPTSRR